MTRQFSLPPVRVTLVLAALALALVLALIAGPTMVGAQVEGDRGISAVVASTDIDVGGIEVDVSGSNPEDARAKGWRDAQRQAWAKIGGPSLSDGQLQSLVSAVVIERERVGPRRYVATLGIIFDRARAGGYLGRGGQRARSAPMLLVPLTVTGGTQLIYEQRNDWQRAWAEYQAGSSKIDYVRPSGAGGDSLLVTAGQINRRSRAWWRNILNQFGASDVIVAIAKLDHEYPGGPVTARFIARYGPDNTYLDGFTLRVANPRQIPAMYNKAIERFDTIYEAALADGRLKPDPTLNQSGGSIDPAIQRLIDAGRQAEAAAAAQRRAEQAERDAAARPAEPTAQPTAAPTAAPVVVSSFVVQFATPDASTIDGTLAAVRSTPGVRGAATSSLAIGGTSVMSVTYGGSLSELAQALAARGFTVRQGSNALAISR
ncbi:heavy-metal-associated domain-containing protein [Qipengyuania sp. DSG2-2]|uniref:heavy-metal-associated domain-containing protein n=1 Tax=Qipengyuania sp. DGS2-2 TaxID=3349631 RepID=UPI0036D35DFD